MRSISGQLLKQMLISAANNLYNHYPEIDALNVFPVPDGDTGMNMNLTLTSGAKEIQNRNDEDVYTIANLFSRGLLMGARGNSGVITSQIFRGFAASLKETKAIKAIDLAEAFANGSKVAYKAVMRPVEGTILTVIRESSEALSNYVKEDMSLEKAMSYLIKEAKASLKRTPELLPVLKEVGVVDSGGAGLVRIFEGMDSALHGAFIEKSLATSVDKVANIPSEEEFTYKLSFKLHIGPKDKKKEFVEYRFKTILENRGENVILERINDDEINISISTLTPGSILTYAQNFGEFSNIHILNSLEKEETPIEVKKVEPQKEYAMVAISAGKGIDDYFKEIGVDKIVSGGQTMNPSIEDIMSAIKACNAKVVYVFPNNSNIVMAALQAADVLSEEVNVQVIPTKTIPQGIVAASAFNPDASYEENAIEMKESYKNLKSGSVTYSIKDTTVDGFKVTKDYFMGICDKKIVSNEKDKVDSLYKLLETMIDDESYLVSIFVGEDVNEYDLNRVVQELPKKHQNVEFDIRKGDQPVYSFLIGVE